MKNATFSGTVEDYVFFRRMLAPLIIKALCWPLMAFCFIGGFVAWFQGHDWGLWLALAAPVSIRVGSEVIILLFKIYDVLVAILRATPGRPTDAEPQPNM